MTSRVIRIVRRSLLVVGAISVLSSGATQTTKPQPADATASIHEARLRKLHLVRPDLINYPIASEVVC